MFRLSQNSLKNNGNCEFATGDQPFPMLQKSHRLTAYGTKKPQANGSYATKEPQANGSYATKEPQANGSYATKEPQETNGCLCYKKLSKL